MSDTDSYLLKCALEELEKGKDPELITEECACRYGYVQAGASQQLTTKETKNDN